MVPTIVEHMLGLKMMWSSVSSSIESSNEKSSDSLDKDLLATPDSVICSLNDKLS